MHPRLGTPLVRAPLAGAHLAARLLAALLSIIVPSALLSAGCTRPASAPGTGTSRGTAQGQTKAKAEAKAKTVTGKLPAAALPKHPAESSWPAAVQVEYRALRSLGETQGAQVIKAVLRLARLGGAAAGALRALHDDGALPARQRTMAGVMYANLHRFDRGTLAALLASPQVHVARHAALLLSMLGGSSAALLAREAQRATDPALRAQLERYAAKTKAEGLPTPVLELLHTLLVNPKADKKQWAGTELAVRYAGVAEKALLGLLSEATADAATRLQASLALIEGHRDDVVKLAVYAQRRSPTMLRLAACRQLARKGAAGRKVLSTLAESKGDPVARHARELLGKP